LVYLAKVAPKGREVTFMAEKLRRYGLSVDESSQDFLSRIQYARNWAEDFEEIKEARIDLTDVEKAAVRDLISLIRSEGDEQKIQNGIFTLARKHSLEAKDFFKALYLVLIGGPEGPRLGPYIVAMGRENVAEALSRTVN
jgi:lysyl-tRNA synthetase class 1